MAANQSFGYDNINRLTGFTPATASQDQSYTYDLNGNRTGITIGTTTYTDTIASTSNQLTGTNGPAPNRTNLYDADGNLTSDGTYSYGYSARGRMATSVSGSNTVSYLYNGLGQRTYKAGPATLVLGGANHYVYDEAGHLLGEYDNHAQLIQETVYLGDTPVGVMTPNGPVVVVDNTDTSSTIVVGTWTASSAVAGFLGIGLRGGLATYSYVNSQPLTRSDSKGLLPDHCGLVFQLFLNLEPWPIPVFQSALCVYYCGPDRCPEDPDYFYSFENIQPIGQPLCPSTIPNPFAS